MLKVYKDKQFMIFEFDDGKTVKYDFATKQSIGKSGKYVKDLRSQLSGLTISQIMECCIDERYAKFLKYVQRREQARQRYIWNIGTILNAIPKYSNYEQFFSAGIDDIVDTNFAYTINDVPKGLIKLCQKHKMTLSNDFLRFYKENIDGYILAYNLEYISLNDDDINKILNAKDRNLINGVWAYRSCFNHLINEYGYTSKALLKYIDYLKTFEAIEDISSILRELIDYAQMMQRISPKFDKYPRYFLSTHKIACRTYNRLKQVFQEEDFAKRIDKELEYQIGEYKFIYPSITQDIKDEAVQQSNCVASYIQGVIDGRCHIMFLRKQNKTKPIEEQYNESLVTLEIRDYEVVQAKGKFNRDCFDNENKMIEQFNLYLQKIKNKREKQLKECVA